MDASVESRLSSLEERVRTLEGLLRVALASAPQPAAPAPPPVPATVAPPPPPPSRAPAPVVREPLDLEQVLGGRVLGWVGGLAVVLAAVFFLVMAVHNGWIDEPTRVVLAFAAATALLLAGLWLYERKGQTQAALAAVAAALAALYAADTTASVVYDLIPAAA